MSTCKDNPLKIVPQSLSHLHGSNDHSIFDELKVSLACGSIGGIASVITGHPFDTIKVRMQTLNQPLRESIKALVSQEGSRALYKGVSSPLYNIPVLSAIDYAAYEYGKYLQGVSSHEPITLGQSLLAGGFSGLCCAIVCNPVELVKCQMQMSGVGERFQGRGSQATATQVGMRILTTEGVQGLYRGMLCCALRDFFGGAVFFGTYSYSKKHIESQFVNDSIAPPLICGALAGVIGWAACYPFDILKTRLQCDMISATPKYHKHAWIPDGGIISCARSIYSESGLIGFMRGMSACAIKASIASSACFLAYEKSRVHLFNTNQSF